MSISASKLRNLSSTLKVSRCSSKAVFIAAGSIKNLIEDSVVKREYPVQSTKICEVRLASSEDILARLRRNESAVVVERPEVVGCAGGAQRVDSELAHQRPSFVCVLLHLIIIVREVKQNLIIHQDRILIRVMKSRKNNIQGQEIFGFEVSHHLLVLLDIIEGRRLVADEADFSPVARTGDVVNAWFLDPVEPELGWESVEDGQNLGISDS